MTATLSQPLVQFYQDDFTKLTEAIAFGRRESEYLMDNGEDGHALREGIMAGGQKARCLFPTGPELFKQYVDGGDNSVCFVGFFGEKKKHVPAELMAQLWEMDKLLLDDLREYSDILMYASAEQEAGGNWFNLVLFESMTVTDRWRDGKNHAVAVKELSPQFYSDVRIHAGVMPLGIMGNQFRSERTTFVRYEDGVKPRKEVRVWADGQDDIFILP